MNFVDLEPFVKVFSANFERHVSQDVFASLKLCCRCHAHIHG